MMNVAEYKLKVRGEGWEETPVFVVVNLDAMRDSLFRSGEARDLVRHGIADEDAAYAVACGISEAYSCEVRWNWVDTHQGHYVGIGSIEQ